MQSVRCLIADIPQLVLADIVRNLAEESSDIEVVDSVNSIEDIWSVIARTPVDVLILGMKNTVLPRMYVDVMQRFSNLAIVGLVDDGRQLAVYMDNVGSSDILRILRALRRTSGE
jgi:DNA-binding NarL/FixJ family response regulator